MFRLVAQGAAGAARRAGALQSSAPIGKVFFSTAAPSVKDVLIDLTFVDPSGARRKAKGLLGKTLYEACELQGINLGPANVAAAPEIARTESWIEPTFGEGITSGYDHVVLVGKGAESADRMTPVEEQMLDDYWDFDEIFEGSRLASAVVLTKEMDGMTVFIPDRIVDDNP